MTADLLSVTANWERSIFIDSEINDELVRGLIPRILHLRQVSNDPITIGINSLGGSLNSLNTLISLLTEASQTAGECNIITVVTYRAYSAAANFLSLGNYAIAYKHSEILFHDVRYGEIGDVTSEKAKVASKRLRIANDEFALKLAHKVIYRLIWVYIDAFSKFDNIKKEYPDIYELNASIVSRYTKGAEVFESVDLAGFSTFLWTKLSRQNNGLITNVMSRLNKWISMSKIANAVPSYREKGSTSPGMLDGMQRLYKLFNGKTVEFKKYEPELNLFLSLLTSEMNSESNKKTNSLEDLLEFVTREYAIHISMNDPKHIEYASSLLSKHQTIFFGMNVDEKTKEEKDDLIKKATPYAALLWHFCIQLCRELFEGEHILSPTDAQLLGLIDEVCGGGPIECRRDYRLRENAKSEV